MTDRSGSSFGSSSRSRSGAGHQVVIAGGGPVGLAAAVELGRRGIDCLVLEPRARVSRSRPRCKTLNVRTLEHLRRWGIADRLRAAAPLPTAWSQDVIFCTSLTGWELSRFHGVFGLLPDGDRFAEIGQQAPQYVLEELLRETVEELPTCTLQTGARVTGLAQTDADVRVVIETDDGERFSTSAEYVIGADGSRSVVREQIGADYEGEQALRPNFGMVFEAPEIWDRLTQANAVQYWIVNPVAPALMGPLDLHGSWWMIAFGVDADTGHREAQRLIDGAVGTSVGASVDARVRSTDPWTARMQMVDRLSSGRVFLAGDAAHLNPPFGGHGLNTGIGDAVDLGWKLAAVLDGWGGRRLLDSYAIERGPLHRRIIDAATANMSVLSDELLDAELDADSAAGQAARRSAGERIQATKAAEFHALDLVLDADGWDSPVVVEDGARLPHLWLAPGRSLYDTLGPELSLLVLEDDRGVAGGRNAAGDHIVAACRRRGVPLTRRVLRSSALRRRVGAGLALVRPDQRIAWRGDELPGDPGALIDVIRGHAIGTGAPGSGPAPTMLEGVPRS